MENPVHMRAGRRPRSVLVAVALTGLGVCAVFLAPIRASAVGTSVGLGTAASYSVLGGQTVTNTGPSVISDNVGVSPGTSITGFPPGITGGAIHASDAHALQAQADLTTAYNDAAGQTLDATVGAELGGLTLGPGVYRAPSSTQITGPLTLDAGGDPNAVFIFQVGSALTTASSSSVVLLNDAQSCHVFWQVGSSATLGTSSTFVGTIMALTSVTAQTGAAVEGRALARNGSVTLDNNVFTAVKCATTSTASPSSASATATQTATSSAGATATVTATGGGATSSVTSGAGASADSSLGGAVSDERIADTGSGLPAPLVGVALAALLLGIGIVRLTARRAS